MSTWNLKSLVKQVKNCRAVIPHLYLQKATRWLKLTRKGSLKKSIVILMVPLGKANTSQSNREKEGILCQPWLYTTRIKHWFKITAISICTRTMIWGRLLKGSSIFLRAKLRSKLLWEEKSSLTEALIFSTRGHSAKTNWKFRGSSCNWTLTLEKLWLCLLVLQSLQTLAIANSLLRIMIKNIRVLSEQWM